MSKIIEYGVQICHLPAGTKVKCIGSKDFYGYELGKIYTLYKSVYGDYTVVNNNFNGFDGRWEIVDECQGLPLFDWASK